MGEKKYNFDDDQSIADLLGSMPHVEPPANFDARVRSRIAQGRPSTSRWLVPSMASASLCAVVFAVVALVYLGEPDVQMSDVAQPEGFPAVVAESPVPQFAASNKPEPANLNTQSVVSDVSAPVVAKRRDRRVSPLKPSVAREGGGSYRIGVEESKAPIVPFGTPTPNPTPHTSVESPISVSKIPVREVLQLIGLDAEFRDDGWLVKKVSENSLAGRSGVLKGDVIEAIDDVKVTGNTTFENGFNGKNLTVLRNGNRQTISLQSR